MSDDLTMDSGALIFATLADVYLSSGMVDEAISILKDGLSRNPTYSLAKVILGRAYYIRGDIEQSLKILEGEYNELQDSETTNLYIGHCYRKLGEYEKAAGYYNIALKLNPDNKEAKQGLEAIGTGVKETVAEKPVESRAEPESEKAEVVEKIEDREIIEEPVIGVALPLDAKTSTGQDIEKPKLKEPEKVETAAQPPTADETTKPEPVPEKKIEEEKLEPEPVIEETIKEEPEIPFAGSEKAEPAPAMEKAELKPAAEPEPPKAEQVIEPSTAVERSKAEPEELPPEVKKEPVVDIGLTVIEEKKARETEVTFPLEALDEPMKKLLNMKTVKGAFICSKDGLLIKNYYEQCADIEVISAMIAAIHNEAQEAFKYLKEGSVEKFIIDKIEHPLCVITAGDSLLTVVTQPEAKPGLVFVYARKIIEEIREILG